MKRTKKTKPDNIKRDYKLTDKVLLSKLVPIHTRRWILHLLQSVVVGLGWSALPAAALFAIERLYMPPAFNGIYLGIVAIVLGFIGGLFYGIITGKYSLLGAAVLSDEALGLKERISTAVVLESHGQVDPVSQQIKTEAHALVNRINPAKIVPLRISPRRLVPAGLTCLTGLLLLLPPLPNTGATQRQKEFNEVKMMAKPLKDLAEQLEKAPIKDLPKERKAKLAQEMKALAKKFDAGRTPKKEALKKLNSIEKKLAEEIKNQSPEAQAKKMLESVSAALKNTKLQDDTKKALEAALKSFDPASELQKQMNKKNDDAFTVSGLKDMAQKLQKQSDKAKNDGDKKLAEELERLAKELAKNAEELKKQQEEMQKILEKMEPAAKELAKELQKNSMNQASKQLAENMQKCLNEFKKSGNIDMNNLEKMNEAIKSAEKTLQEGKTPDGKKLDNKSAESLQKATEEMRKYLKEAQQCNGQCKNCQNKAAQNLTIGAKEGMNMGQKTDSQQMMQQLMQQLQAMREGGVPIPYGQTGEDGTGKNGGKGDKEGKGASGWGYGSSAQKTEGYDVDKKSQTERRDFKNSGNKYDAVRTEKFYDPSKIDTKAYDTQVKGNLGDEGEMNVQEFSALPTKERGSTKYYQTVNNASRAAESSMETEDIPIEYRELVRQYFSELKEKEAAQNKSEKSSKK